MDQGQQSNVRPATPASDRHLWQFRWVRDLAALAVAGVVLWAAYRASSITVPILIGLALAYIFNPLITWAKARWRVPRWCSAVVIMATFVLAVGLFAWIAVPPLVIQAGDLGGKVPAYVAEGAKRLGIEIDREQIRREWERLRSMEIGLGEGAAPADETGAAQDGGEDQAEAGAGLAQYAGAATDVLQYVARWLWRMIVALLGIITYLPVAALIIGFCFFVFSWRWAPFTHWFEQFLPRSNREHTLEIMRKMDRSVSGFLRGRLVQSVIMGVVLSLGWWIAGVPYWLLLGILCGLLNLVPLLAVVGWLAALLLVYVDAISEGGQGFSWGLIVWPSVIYFVAQALDGWVVEPIVQGKATELDPLSVLLAVLIGASLAGVLGMLLAIPAAACIKILAREVLIPHLRGLAERQ